MRNRDNNFNMWNINRKGRSPQNQNNNLSFGLPNMTRTLLTTPFGDPLTRITISTTSPSINSRGQSTFRSEGGKILIKYLSQKQT
jgi:hypothetical protein